MTEITIGTTPSIRYDFKVMDPADFVQAILTIKDGNEEKIRKTLEDAQIGDGYIEFRLSQEETLSLGAGGRYEMMLNYKTTDGTRGASHTEMIICADNHISEVI